MDRAGVDGSGANVQDIGRRMNEEEDSLWNDKGENQVRIRAPKENKINSGEEELGFSRLS